MERRTLYLPKWDADGFKVALVADLHVNFRQAMERTREAVGLALAEKPDVFVAVGDFVNVGLPEVLQNVRDAFDPTHAASCPCLAVLGNHDYWVWEPRDVMTAVRDSGLTLLRNEAVELEGVTVAGLDDGLMNRARYDLLREGAFSKSLLVLLHEPDFVHLVPDNASLQLSGHTHGGQMCLPFGIAVHTPRGSGRYTQGFYPEAPTPLYVTRGVGTTGLDFRTFCPPEVSILTLRGR